LRGWGGRGTLAGVVSSAVQPPVAGREPFRAVPVESQEGGRAKGGGSERLISLDAFRGFIMTTLAAHGFGLATLAETPGWAWLGLQFEHVEWEGLVFWDLIQPAFMFMVGLAMPFAVAARVRKSGPDTVWKHVAYRAVMLIVISNVIMSISRGEPHFQLINVLAQIGFTYFICYGLMQASFRFQAVAAAAILVGYTALFIAFPGEGGAFAMGDNWGERVDEWVFGKANPGHWATVNFIPSVVVTLAGVWAGRLMIEPRPHAARMRILAMAAAACLAAGYGLGLVIPIIKRIHTASFTLAACGWVLLMLLGFYWLVEVRERKSLTFPLVVVGMNSIFIYCLNILLGGWIRRATDVFTGGWEFLGAAAPIAQALSMFAVMWCLCWWLYRRRIFIKV